MICRTTWLNARFAITHEHHRTAQPSATATATATALHDAAEGIVAPSQRNWLCGRASCRFDRGAVAVDRGLV